MSQIEKVGYFFNGSEKRFAYPSPKLAEMIEQLQALKQQVRKAEAAGVAATFLEVFEKHAFLRSLKVSYSASNEYDDEGGNYRSIGVTVSDIETVEGSEIPQDYRYEQGVLDEERMADYLQEAYFYEDASTAYESFTCHDSQSYDDVDLIVNRHAAEPFLNKGEIDCRDAFIALFPESADLV